VNQLNYLCCIICRWLLLKRLAMYIMLPYKGLN
jgi:hypothetical protein